MGSVWIHAASVGEVSAAEVLWRSLSGPRFLTTDTDTGLARARRFTPLSARRPWEVPAVVDDALAQARPRALVFVEGTWWPVLAGRAARAGIPVLRVSARAGPRTRVVPTPLLRSLWGAATAVAAKDEGEAAFLRSAHRVPVEVLGDLKAGVCPPASPLRWSRPFVVGASLRRDDLVPMLTGWARGGGDHALLLAPRHPQDHDPDALLRGRRWVRRSQLADRVVPADVEVVWLDTLGELAGCFQGAAAAFVGGTFDPRLGGHAADEALAWGVPVLAGPERQANPRSLAHGALVSRPEGLGEVLRTVLAAPPAVHARDEGVGDRVARFVEAWGRPCPELSPRPWARPLALPYRALQRLDRSRRRFRPYRAPVPVISVGSANARSPGRTSTVRWLATRLEAQGERVGIALRGYRRRHRGLATSWSGPAAPPRLGDEGAMLALRWSVAASARRSEAVQALAAHGCTVVLLDDGRQAVEIHRDLEVEVVDGRYPGARGVLPAGERRTEGWGDGDVLLVHHPEAWPERPPGSVAVQRRPGPWLRGGEPVAEGPQEPVAVWLAIGHPEEVLAGLDVEVGALRVDPDHAWPPADLSAWVGTRPLVCTEKDRVRLPPALAATAWTRPLELVIEDVGWLDGGWR